jgi:hypothetical protein
MSEWKERKIQLPGPEDDAKRSSGHHYDGSDDDDDDNGDTGDNNDDGTGANNGGGSALNSSYQAFQNASGVAYARQPWQAGVGRLVVQDKLMPRHSTTTIAHLIFPQF